MVQPPFCFTILAGFSAFLPRIRHWSGGRNRASVQVVGAAQVFRFHRWLLVPAGLPVAGTAVFVVAGIGESGTAAFVAAGIGEPGTVALAVPTAYPSSSLSRLQPGRPIMTHPHPSRSLPWGIIMGSRVFSCMVLPKMVLFRTYVILLCFS